VGKISDKILVGIRRSPPSAGKAIPARPQALHPSVVERLKRHRKRQKAKAIAVVLVVALCLVGLGILLSWPLKTPTGESITRARILANMMASAKPLPYFFYGKDSINVLVVGLDKDPPHRSDTVMVANLGLNDLQVNILSIPRDLLVTLPSGHQDKLAHAYAYGEGQERNGVGWVKKAVENLLGLPIDFYIAVDFEGFVRTVDVLGGVRIFVDKPLRYKDRAQGLVIDIPEGEQVMDGKTLLGYVRFRHDALGDIGRTKRQQQALSAVLEKLKETRSWDVTLRLVRTLYSSVKTNFTLDQLVALARRVNDFSKDKIHAETLNSSSTMIGGVSYQQATNEDILKGVELLLAGKTFGEDYPQTVQPTQETQSDRGE